MKCVFHLILCILLLPSLVQALQVFPGAEGYGTDTPAGRGGTVYKVTNLNDAGTGSLRACVEASGPRVCVFEVSGTITLNDFLRVYNPYITIAGQTAPSPGITLRGATLNIRTHDVLVQHLRVRVGDDPSGAIGSERDGISISNPNTPPYNVVIDHCSVSWAIDEVVSAWYPSHNITIQWSIVSEGLYDSLHHKGGHSMGILFGPGYTEGSIRGSVHHSLMAHNMDRNPLIAHDTETEIINNVAYDWMWYAAIKLDNCGDYPEDQPTLSNVIGNYHITGPSRRSSRNKSIRIGECWNDSKVYIQGNVGPGRPADEGDEWAIVDNLAGIGVKASEPALQPSGITNHSATEAYDLVLANAGARPADRDSVDIRIVNEVESGTGSVVDCVGPDPIYYPTGTARGGASNSITLATDASSYDDRYNAKQIEITAGRGAGQTLEISDYVGSTRVAYVTPDWSTTPDTTSQYRVIIDCSNNAGGWPVLEENYRTLTLPDNPNGDDDADGYTNLEEWLHAFSAEVENSSVTQETVFSTLDPYLGDSINWEPLTPSRWEVLSDMGDLRYGIITTNYENLSGSRLGEIKDISYTDFLFNATVRSTDDFVSNPTADYDIVFGYQDPDNYYYMMFSSNPVNSDLFRIVNGNRELVADSAGLAVSDNNYHDIALERQGDFIRVYFDGSLVLETQDSTFGSGRVGIGGFNDASLWDDITATSHIFSNLDPYLGDSLNWEPLTPSRWEVLSDMGDLRYGIITTNYENLSGSRLGEFVSNPGADYDIVFGYQDPDNYYYMMFNRLGPNSDLFRIVNGQRELIAETNDFSIPDNNYHDVETRRLGENIKVYFDGSLILDAADSTLSSGRVGVGGFNDASLWDDIVVRETHRADNSPQDGCIETHELLAFIDRWKISSKDVPMPELMEAIGLWKAGTNCS
jgi:hypothetical protein